MATAKKINPTAQAPDLIRKIQDDLEWTQKDLEGYLGMRQQSVSNYRAGRIDREQYDVIKKLEYILAKKLPPPTVEEVIKSETRNVASTRGDGTAGQNGAKKASSRVIQTRRNEGRSRKSR